MRFLRCVTILLLLGSLGGLPAVADDPLFSGSAESLWLVRPNEGGESIDVFRRKLGKSWQPVVRRLSGKPTHIQAVGGTLHVFFPQGRYLLIDPDGNGTPGRNAPGKVRALGALPTAWTNSNAALVAPVYRDSDPVIPDRSPPRAATRPSRRAAQPPQAEEGGGRNRVGASTQPPEESKTQPAEGYLCVYLAQAGHWRAVWAEPAPARPTGVRVTSMDREIVLVVQSTSKARPRMLRIGPNQRAGTWTDLAWENQPIGLAGLPTGLVAVLPQPEPESNRVRLALVRWDQQAGRFQPAPDADPLLMSEDGKPRTFPASSTVTRFGEQLAVCWQDKTLRMVLCDPTTGELSGEEVIDESLASLPDAKTVLRIHNYFNWVVIVLIAMATFLLKPQTPPGLFSLPKGMKPGNLLKRLLAALVDYLPFLFVALAAVSPTLPPPRELPGWDNLMGGDMVVPPVALFVGWLASLGTYVSYCVGMELWRGATPGKMLLGLRVVGDKGLRPQLREVLLRNLLKLIELMMMMYVPVLMIIPLLVPLLTRNRQRLGDWIARTAVVESRLIPPILSADASAGKTEDASESSQADQPGESSGQTRSADGSAEDSENT